MTQATSSPKNPGRFNALDPVIELVSRQRYPEVQVLKQLPGVGPITAQAFVLLIEYPERFWRNRSVGA